jgi:predicted nucleotidyltransferase
MEKIQRKVCSLITELKKYGFEPDKVFLFGSAVSLFGKKSRKPFRPSSDIDIGICFTDGREWKVYDLPIWGESTSYGYVDGHRVEVTSFNCSNITDETIESFFKDIIWLKKCTERKI